MECPAMNPRAWQSGSYAAALVPITRFSVFYFQIVGKPEVEKLRRLHFDSESWMRTVAVCGLCAGSVTVLSFGKAPF
jgi:hypothetical protein